MGGNSTHRLPLLKVDMGNLVGKVVPICAIREIYAVDSVEFPALARPCRGSTPTRFRHVMAAEG
jgi:hypothetical protein